MPKLNQSIIETVIDENGIIKNTRTKQKLSWGDEPPFIKLYLQDIMYLSDIPNKHEKVLYELLKKSSYADSTDGMEVIINSSLKRRIALCLKMKNIGSISNAITDLVKGKILIRADVGIYKFNPYFFGKGDWQDIVKLRLEINYDEIKGRTFQTVCSFASKTEGKGVNYD